MIDDRAAFASTQQLATWTEAQLVKVGTGLGCYFSFGTPVVGPTGTLHFSKMEVLGTQEFQFLGIIVHVAEQQLSISDKKLNYFVQYVAGLLARENAAVTHRELARAAGMLLSYAPAIQVARLYSKALYLMVTDQKGWDSIIESPQQALTTLQFGMTTSASSTASRGPPLRWGSPWPGTRQSLPEGRIR